MRLSITGLTNRSPLLKDLATHGYLYSMKTLSDVLECKKALIKKHSKCECFAR